MKRDIQSCYDTFIVFMNTKVINSKLGCELHYIISMMHNSYNEKQFIVANKCIKRFRKIVKKTCRKELVIRTRRNHYHRLRHFCLLAEKHKHDTNMKLEAFLESVWQRDPKGANSAAHLSYLLSTKWSHRRAGRCYRKEAEAFLAKKKAQHDAKIREYHEQQAAMEVARDFFSIFTGKLHLGTPDEEGGFVLGLKYDLPENKPVTIIRGMGGNPFMSL